MDERKAHNLFNIVYIGVIAIMSTYSWWLKLEGGDLTLLSLITLLYYIMDIIFLVLRPDSTNSPVTILMHHVLALLSCFVFYGFPDLRSLGVQYLLVDVNTWFLAVRQTLSKRYLIIEVAFYASWVVIRLIHYPLLMLKVWSRFQEGTTLKLLTAMTLFLNIMNFKWTVDIVKRIMHSKLDKDYDL